MANKLTKIVKETDLNEEHTIELKNGVTLKSRDYDFSSPQAVERMKKIHEIQNKIKKSKYFSLEAADKIYFPQFGPNYGRH